MKIYWRMLAKHYYIRTMYIVEFTMKVYFLPQFIISENRKEFRSLQNKDIKHFTVYKTNSYKKNLVLICNKILNLKITGCELEFISFDIFIRFKAVPNLIGN